MLLSVVAAIPVLIWTYLLFFRGAFWRVSTVPDEVPLAQNRTRLCIVIAARNEAAVIDAALTSLFRQRFPAPLHVFLVDDGSTDGTAEIAALAAHRAGKDSFLTVIEGRELAPGWTGKLWALLQGVAAAEKLAPDYLLLTDADIVHASDSIVQLVAIARTGNYDLASMMVKLACVSFAEKALIPAFVFFFLKLYPPRWVASRRSSVAGAAGGCVLIRPEALRKIGGLAAIRDQIIDDCALAKSVKRTGGRVWLGLSSTTVSIRSYGAFGEIGRMISRTAFNQLRHSTALLVAALMGMLLTYLLPPLLLATGQRLPMVLGAVAWLMMSIAYAPMLRFYCRSIFWAVCLPVIASFYLGATIHSAVRYWRGTGGEWKGRVQDAPS